MRILSVLALTSTLASAPPAQALSLQDAPSIPSAVLPPAPPGVAPWDVLGRASVVFGEADGKETVTTIIPPEIEALDGAPVTLMGFMFPIEAQPQLRRFLLVEYPADCPFCLAGMVEPSRMVEVEAGPAIEWRDEPVTIEGRLEVVRSDADGLVYCLRDAHLAP